MSDAAALAALAIAIVSAIAGSALVPAKAHLGAWHRLALGFFIALGLASALALCFEGLALAGYALPLAVAIVIVALWQLSRLERPALRPLPTAAIAVVVLAMLTVVLLTPLYAWDAWSFWLYRADALALYPQARFSLPTTASAIGAYGVAAPDYPMLLTAGWIWIGRVLDARPSEVVPVLWPLAWLAALGAGDAVARTLGITPIVRLVVAVTVGAAPLAVTHALMPGYVDIWLMGFVLVAAWAVANAIVAPRFSAPAVLLALAAVFALTQVKLEGTLWAAALAAGVIVAARPRFALVAVLAVAAVASVALLIGGGRIALFDGALVIAGDALRIPLLGDSALAPVANRTALITALIEFASFGVGPWVALGLIGGGGAARLRVRAAAAAKGDAAIALARRTLVVTALLALAAIAFLFFLTDASRWLADQTSFSRVLLQVWPLALIAAACAVPRRAAEPRDARADRVG